METHGIRTGGERKEFQCEDCGHLYLVARGQSSSRCDVCGNIAFHSASPEPLRDLARTPMQLLKEKVLAKIARIPREEKDPRKDFQRQPDGARVQEILVKYQVEWQLWAMLVKQFHDPDFHAAYLTQAALFREYDRAAARYREHRNVMALLREDHWQAEIADLMLERLSAVSNAQLESHRHRGIPFLPDWKMPESRLFRLGWFCAGLFVLFRLFF